MRIHHSFPPNVPEKETPAASFVAAGVSGQTVV
jgi:hypothetical protein